MTATTAERWTCSYCLGVRLGDQCSGCGAPRQGQPASRIDPLREVAAHVEALRAGVLPALRRPTRDVR